MLRNRLITSAVLAPLIVVAVVKLPPLWFTYCWGVIVAIAAWEWSGLAGLGRVAGRVAFVAALVIPQLTGKYWAPFAIDWLPWVAVSWWFVVGMAMRMIPDRLMKLRYPVALLLCMGWFVLLTAWILVVWLRVNFGVKQVLFLVVLIWLADAAAYFVGKRFGRTKLLPQISPGKTVEGVYGALIITAMYAAAVGFYLEWEPIVVSDFVVLALLTVIISIAGDLFESLAKRLRGVKDSGVLFPGHGGMLDRIDSLVAGVAVFYAGSYLREIFL